MRKVNYIKPITLSVFAALLLIGCAYDLDVTGFFGTSESVQDRFLGSLEWTATHEEFEVISDAATYSMLIGGDSHVGTVVNLETMLQKAVAQGALAISIAGDVTTGLEEDHIRTDSIFQAYPEVEKFVVPGNHDLYFKGWDTFFDLFGPSAYTLKIHSRDTSDLFLFLDSGSGTLGVDQLNWLAETLQQERELYRYAIVITHLNFFRNRFTGSTNPINEEVLTLLDLFTENNVQLVIQGHDHKRYETSLGETTYLTLDALKDGTKNASYLELTIDNEGISTVFHEL